MCRLRWRVTLIRLCSARFKASWSALNRPAEPGMAMATKRSFPRILDQVFLLTRRRVFKSSNILARVSLR